MERLAKASVRDTRTHNERLVLETFYNDGPVSRADVARMTGLTRTTISDLATDLLHAGLVREIGRGPSTGGKAPILLEVVDDARYLVGIDLGGGVFRGAVMNLRGDVCRAADVPSGDGDGQQAVVQVEELADQLLADLERPVLGIGIGAPGLIDTTDGLVIQSVNVDWRGLPLGAMMTSRYGLPVYVANDSQVVAVAEQSFGPVLSPNLIAVKVGRGIGAGLVLNGSLFQGDGHGAGEIGHTVVVPGGDPCRCGRRGCLETVASERAVLARISAETGATTTLDAALGALQSGNEVVRRVVVEAGEFLGAALAGLVGALNVQRIVLVGPMTAFGDPWLSAVRERVASGALPALARNTHVELGPGDDAVLLGAVALLMRRERGLRRGPRRDSPPATHPNAVPPRGGQITE